MCRNIRPLFNYDPPATDKEIHQASLQFVRKISGYSKPSKANKEPFDQAVEDIEKVVQNLLDSMTTSSKPKDREVEAEKRRKINEKRFGKRNN